MLPRAARKRRSDFPAVPRRSGKGNNKARASNGSNGTISRRNSESYAPNSVRRNRGPKAPADAAIKRQKFHGEWDEIEYLYRKIVFWWYQREDRAKALLYSARLEPLLRKVAAVNKAILGEECWSLFWEVNGDLGKAIKHRKREIRLIQELWRSAAESPQKRVLLQGYGPRDLSDRLDLLAILYHDAGDLNKSLRTLKQSEELCAAYRIPFDGREILEEYLALKTA